MTKAYTAYALAILGLYGMAGLWGWELFADKRGLIPPSVRQAPGGYRSYGYWRGGK